MRDPKIAQAIRRWLNTAQEHESGLARAIQYDQGNLNRMFNGKRAWNIQVLSKICEHFGKKLSSLLEDVEIPVVGQISAGDSIPYALVDSPLNGWGMVPIPPGVPMSDLSRIYALRIKGKSMEPAFKDGTIIYAKRESHQEIKNGDFVVFVDDQGNAWIKKIIFGDDVVIIRSLNPEYDDVILDRSRLRVMDRVIFARF